MTKIAGHVFRPLWIVSLVLCAGISALWAYSFRSDVFLYVSYRHEFTLRVSRGAVTWRRTYFPRDDKSRLLGDFRFVGFEFHHQNLPKPTFRPNVVRPRRYWVLRAPVWSYLLIALIAPAWSIWSNARRWRRRKRGRCMSCGYDLRGTREAGGERCPECGGSYVSP